MPCPASGTISIQSLVDEFGGDAPHSLSEYYRNGGLVPGNNTNVPESGEFSLTDCYSAVNEIQHTHSDGDTHANYATIFGSNYASTVPKRVIVPAGVTVGGTTTHAMLLPSGMGGTIVFDISGNVHGHGGTANGGNGGNAIHCIQTTGVTINVASSGKLQAGGGGGGQGGSSGAGGAGGAGGTGGAGGMGYYWSSSYGSYDYREVNVFRNRAGRPCQAFWRHTYNFPYNSQSGGRYNFPSDGECYKGTRFQTQGSGRHYDSNPHGSCAYGYSFGCGLSNGKTTGCFATTGFEYEIDSYGNCDWHNTGCIKRLFQNGASGGAGGSGGSGGSAAAGGAGGVGQGFNQSAGSGSAGAAGNAGATGNAGAAGSSGSNNAGNGGQGGTGGQGGSSGQGGLGGNGGAFGASGTAGGTGSDGAGGNTGSTGNTGANGNTYNGSAGSAGSSGSSGNSGSNGSGGGSPGYYIFNRSSITLNTSAGATLSGQ